MKILLSYSKNHFDPTSSRVSKYRYTSAANIASNLYRLLTNYGDVEYIDSGEFESVRNKEYDYIFGIANNFEKIIKLVKFKKSILIAVNMHPTKRNKILRDFISANKLSKSSYSAWDMHPNNFAKAIKGCSQILLFGNSITRNSYISQSTAPEKIITLNYGSSVPAKLANNRKTHHNFLYYVSEVGLRKGFDIIQGLFIDLHQKDINFSLTVVGKCTNRHYQQQIYDLQKILRGKFKHIDWVKPGTALYYKILSSNDYVIVPSLEEGQVGSLLDCIKSGLVPLITNTTGYSYAPFGYLEKEISSDVNHRILLEAISTSNTNYREIRKKSLNYYKKYHESWSKKLASVLDKLLNDSDVWPKFNFILPVHNKQNSIYNLLCLLNHPLNKYRNVDLHIILDGCSDNTSSVVNKWIKKSRRFYQVRVSTLNDVFEVKSNNYGLKQSNGDYSVIIQDDNYIYDRYFLFDFAYVLQTFHDYAIIGGLAGVNYYPLGTKLSGSGQIAMAKNEVYWRQDLQTSEELIKYFYEVDACMRGPLVIRNQLLEQHGYLDEVYAPLYQDDIDICFRFKSIGYKIGVLLIDVVNASQTIANYDSKMMKKWEKIIVRNAKIFYKRWHPSSEKNYIKISHSKIQDGIIIKYLSHIIYRTDGRTLLKYCMDKIYAFIFQ